MATTEEIVQRLNDSRPPATDAFTYLTIVEKSLSSAPEPEEILSAIHEILEDATLTAEIGWDMVEMLIPIPGSEGCLEAIARLGNPREVILKVLEVMDSQAESSEAGDKVANKRFIMLLGMLGVLHRRLQVKAPSRFLHNSLQAVYRAYDPRGAETTAAVIDFVRSLSGRKRPPLPTRQSSAKLETPFQESDPSMSAPDPEAEGTNPAEPQLIQKLLQSFITSIIEAYVNSNSMEWASRLMEYCAPERIVPGKPTMLQMFKEVEECQTIDALVGQLVAVAGDLGLSQLSTEQVKAVIEAPVCKNPLAVEPDSRRPEDIKLSTGGFLCLVAYQMFAADIFDAHYKQPDLSIFPDHYHLLQNFFGEDQQERIASNPGTVEALIVVALWLKDQNKLVAAEGEKSDKDANYMSYHHLLTLVSVFHPSIRVRNAATLLAGQVLHADPDEQDRIAILEDLLENCMFSSLQACAVTWLREELIQAKKSNTKSRFASPECLDGLQYILFQDLTCLSTTDMVAFYEFWAQNSPFHLQVANFALFIFGGNNYKDLAPAGMAGAVENRYVEPLMAAAKALKLAIEKTEVDAGGAETDVLMQLGILTDTLERVPLH